MRTTLGPGETNELVEFFLRLGGHYIDPAYNDGNPSRKTARWELAGQDPEKFMSYVSATYPLTGGLERLAVVRALLDAGEYLGEPLPQFRQVFGSRAYDHHGLPIWPGTNVDFVGGGLRSVVWFEDLADPGLVIHQGYQTRFLSMGGSYATLLALFPDNAGVESYFWCTPGVQAMGIDPQRFDVHMDAQAANVLLESRFSTYLNHYVPPIIQYSYP